MYSWVCVDKSNMEYWITFDINNMQYDYNILQEYNCIKDVYNTYYILLVRPRSSLLNYNVYTTNLTAQNTAELIPHNGSLS